MSEGIVFGRNKSETEPEFKLRLLGEIASRVARGDFSGIQAQSESLADDLVRWAQARGGRPVDEVRDYTTWLLEGAKLELKPSESKTRFVDAAQEMLNNL